MPTFTVLTPHYSEKILLSLREIIREEDQNTRVTLLEYLKQLHPIEWDNFVRDTKILAEESADLDVDEKTDKKTDDIPFYTIGFKSAAPEYTLRTRIWASLRAQTLYRTVSGFMNYSKAIKLMYRVENPEVVQFFGANTDRLELELERMARRKFRFVVSMQRYAKFSKEEVENTEFLLRAYPDLQIAYLDEERPRQAGGEPRIFSALIDGHSEMLPDGRRRPKFRIELPGNPILGDGKSDNQNHAVIFHRGEYVQLIDANQDNYLEECLKIRNVLGEFEDYHVSPKNPYSPDGAKDFAKNPVAIVGAREYIFSENIGILGDVAAGKEQTFGTLAARSMAYLGGKLHYGHPDFLNAIFMTTRGGLSKAQKGLHLSEDIYAGMLANERGGKIKHTEYYQVRASFLSSPLLASPRLFLCLGRCFCVSKLTAEHACSRSVVRAATSGSAPSSTLRPRSRRAWASRCSRASTTTSGPSSRWTGSSRSTTATPGSTSTTSSSSSRSSSSCTRCCTSARSTSSCPSAATRRRASLSADRAGATTSYPSTTGSSAASSPSSSSSSSVRCASFAVSSSCP